MNMIEDLTLFDNTDFVQLVRIVTITEPGTYYFGFQAYGEVQYFMFVDDFELHKGDVVGIKEEIAEHLKAVSIFPNPAKDIVNLVSEVEMSQVKIFDMFGRNIATYQVTGNELTLGTSQWSSGLYLAEITTKDNQNIVKKFSIVK